MIRPGTVTSRLAQTRMAAGPHATGRRLRALHFVVPGAGPVEARVGQEHFALGSSIEAIIEHDGMYFLVPEGSAAAWLVPASMVTSAED